ncbi:MAG TPA: DUF305 domain-containing protein [Thermoanaerobaculia bacterium]|nr:DUF305 domain-containing protein [Thermoanaerobaculia bacterium]
MKKLIWCLAVSFLVVIVMACQKEETKSDPAAQDFKSATTASSATPAPVAPASSPYDLQFLDTMSKHHASAIEMAKMAQGKIEQPELKALVAKIPVDQQKEIDQMKSWRDQWYPAAPSAENMKMPGMSSSMNMDMGGMQSMKQGHDYDLMFIDMMVPHHEAAVMMSREALTKAQHPEIKKLAQQIIDAQTKESGEMKKWKEGLAKGGQAHKH